VDITQNRFDELTHYVEQEFENMNDNFSGTILAQTKLQKTLVKNNENNKTIFNVRNLTNTKKLEFGINSELETNQQVKLKTLFIRFADCFAQHDIMDLGTINIGDKPITTLTDGPVNLPPYRLALCEWKLCKTETHNISTICSNFLPTSHTTRVELNKRYNSVISSQKRNRFKRVLSNANGNFEEWAFDSVNQINVIHQYGIYLCALILGYIIIHIMIKKIIWFYIGETFKEIMNSQRIRFRDRIV